MIIDYSLLKTSRSYRTKLYQSKLWAVTRDIMLSEEPLCRTCKKNGRIRLAQVVDHIIDITVSPHLCLDLDNLQPLCYECHNEKTFATTNNPKATGIVNSAIEFDILD